MEVSCRVAFLRDPTTLDTCVDRVAPSVDWPSPLSTTRSSRRIEPHTALFHTLEIVASLTHFPTIPKSSRYLSVFWTRSPAMMPIVVGRLAAHTPSRLSVFSSMPASRRRASVKGVRLRKVCKCGRRAAAEGVQVWKAHGCGRRASVEGVQVLQACGCGRHAGRGKRQVLRVCMHQFFCVTGEERLAVRTPSLERLPVDAYVWQAVESVRGVESASDMDSLHVLPFVGWKGGGEVVGRW
eukprot:356780-Chlamydomonas_euryale.AAC.8